jgi:hypothetical protein
MVQNLLTTSLPFGDSRHGLYWFVADHYGKLLSQRLKATLAHLYKSVKTLFTILSTVVNNAYDNRFLTTKKQPKWLITNFV